MQILNDRIALVTGGSRGIGASISKTLAENGAFVLLLKRSPQTTAFTAPPKRRLKRSR
jgi:NAD(P)-dependent dehydrogenase (short-subunit alcohol dehydrogenase family)